MFGYNESEKQFLVSGFAEGFRVPFAGELPLNNGTRNHPSAMANKTIVSSKLKEELAAGRIIGPFSSKPCNLVCSPLALVPKKEPGKFRLIQDLSFPKGRSINDGIDSQFTEVHYDTIDVVINKVKMFDRNCLMAKTDIENAFRIIPIHPDDRHLLGFAWALEDTVEFYMDSCLVMGLSISCQLFSRFSAASQWIMETRYQASMSHILDDFFFVGAPESRQCQDHLDQFLHLCKSINIPIKQQKTVRPTTCITIYGIEVDSSAMITRLPEDKVDRIRNLLEQFKCRKKVLLKELQSLLGLLNFATTCVVPGRTFLRRLYDLTIGCKSQNFYIRLNNDARADLAMWYSFMQSFNGKCMFLNDEWVPSDALNLYTDAAGSLGFAAVYGCEWVAEKWPITFRSYHINILELFPIILAVEMWGHKMANHKVVFFSDNQTSVFVLNNLTSKDPVMMQLIRRLVLLTMKFNILFRAQHVSGRNNSVADQLSRFNFQKALQEAPYLSPTPTPVPVHLLKV